MLEAPRYFGGGFANLRSFTLCAILVLCDPAFAQRWAQPIPQGEEASLTSTLIRAIRAENWLEAIEIADRHRGSPTSAFSQYQAFAYAMTGRLDLVAELQDAGQVPRAAVCSGELNVVYRDAIETIVEAAAKRCRYCSLPAIS